jgi:hypothetical protein
MQTRREVSSLAALCSGRLLVAVAPWTIFHHANQANQASNELTGIPKRPKTFFVNLGLCRWLPAVL